MEPKKKFSWPPRKMKIAIWAIRGGAKLRPTVALYGIPDRTLSDYSKRDNYDISFRMGRKPVFTSKQVTEITKILKREKNKVVKIKKSLKKQIENENSSSSNDEQDVLCDDEKELDDDFVKGSGGETGVEELCVICDDFGKDKKIVIKVC